MDFHSSPRTKIRFITYHPVQTSLEKSNRQLTPTGTRQSSSFIESKKNQKANTIGMQKSSKIFKAKIDPQIEAISRTKKALGSRKTIVNVINESQLQEIRNLKSEISILKGSLNTASTQIVNLKESYEKKIQDLQDESNHYKKEFFRLVDLIVASNEVSNKFREEIYEFLKAKNMYKGLELPKILDDNIRIVGELSPFEIVAAYKSEEPTARFHSLTEAQIKESMTPINEGIILETFSEPNEEYLELKAGDRVQVIKKIDDDWWIGMHNKKVGKFPAKAVLLD
ncbi:hypothetical protein SteCoe_29671 [Stentor coeruleus]|uniref:SH3 domain-containing protein n=1 Tax=Stentor coeruleus TaxID=5963 RepID=A0A1R2B5P6_9CILI|nr:hypothetical protein SteCoe_29671 [Stentor coeruleus]